MDYKNIIFLTKDSIKAVDVGLDGSCDVISLNGHEEIPCKTAQDLKGFCDCLKDAYNIDEFSDLDIETLVIYGKVKNEMLFALHELLKECKQINMIDIEKVIPIIAEKKGLLSEEEKILVEYAGMYYQLHCGADHMVQVCFAKASEDNCVHLQNEDFNILYYYKNQMAVSAEAIKKIEAEYRSEMETLKQEFAVVEEKLNKENAELVNKVREYEAQLCAKKEAEKRNNFKRIVYKLDYNASIPIWITEDDFKDRYYKQLYFYPPTEKEVPLRLKEYKQKSLPTREAIHATKVNLEGEDGNGIYIYKGLAVKKLYKDNSYVTKGTVVGIIVIKKERSKISPLSIIDKTLELVDQDAYDLSLNSIDAYKKEDVYFFEIKAEMDGKIYWIDNHGEYLQDQDDYLILIEKDDTKANAIEWYKETKAKEAEENVGTF